MDRDCEHCIYHDDGCRRWDCDQVTREQAEEAIKKINIIKDLFLKYEAERYKNTRSELEIKAEGYSVIKDWVIPKR